MDRAVFKRRTFLLARLLVGLAYFALVAAFLSLATRANFLIVYPMLLGGVALSAAIGLAWLALWARWADSRLGQFQIGSLFFLMAEGALLLGAIRWTATHLPPAAIANPEDQIALFAVVGAVWLVVAGFGLPLTLCMAEAVLWSAVWLIKQPVAVRAARLLIRAASRLRFD